MKNIVLDTCFILTALKFRIDIKSELKRILEEKFKIFYIDKTLNELKNKPLEKLSLDILSNLNATPIQTDSERNVDSLLIAHVGTNPDDLIATQDKRLKEKLKKRNARIITIRQKRYLKIVN